MYMYVYIYIYIYIYIVYAPHPNTSQEEDQHKLETIREYLETTCSDKSISSNSLRSCKLKYHQKSGFAIGSKFAPAYSNLLMAGL